MNDQACTIRPAVAEDFPMVEELEHILFRLHASRRPDLFQDEDPGYRREWYESFLAGDNIALVAEVDGQGAGMCLAKVLTPPEGGVLRPVRECKIDDLAVLPAFRRRGIATALMEETRRQAKARDCKFCQLNVWTLDQEAAQLYEKLGFVPRKSTLEMPL